MDVQLGTVLEFKISAVSGEGIWGFWGHHWGLQQNQGVYLRYLQKQVQIQAMGDIEYY